ncbi:hypothetical protein [Micromonospora sp. U21]|uniref:hypothetical protein n=1 Tax=Micromonospora sp. U21 TaxID=2824899 RepID=UPI0027DCB831|nr:hypothetical protein [Micromonospora sp. U21]
MKRFRVTSTVLICASLMTLAACGGEDSATTAGSTPSASTASSSAAAPSTSASTTAAASDKELCESAKKASDDGRALLLKAVQSGKAPTPAEFKEILTDLEQKFTTAAAAGGDGKVAPIMKQFAAEAAKAAAAADPATAADSPAFVKVGADLSAACKAVGVTATF